MKGLTDEKVPNIKDVARWLAKAKSDGPTGFIVEGGSKKEVDIGSQPEKDPKFLELDQAPMAKLYQVDSFELS